MRKINYLIIIYVIFSLGCKKSATNNLQTFDLQEVKITKGPFYQAQQADLKYMLALDPDRLLAPFLIGAGLEPLKENYGNWENTGLDGHIGGHYLSALAFMYASTGNKEVLSRIEYMLDWLGKCQEKSGDGYVSGIPEGKDMWNEISEGKIDAGSFSLNKRWVPLYNIHKLFAGLRDVYLNTGNKKSLEILIKLTNWFIETTKNLSDDQVQELLKSEHGGLNEVFADVSDITGESKYLALAKRFSDKSLLNPLLKKQNELTGLHSNTQIPKVIGYKRYADLAMDSSWSAAAVFFWNTVINKWTVSIGGNSVREHFHPADDFSSMIESNQGPETCNTYNMLKLTKLLFMSDPESKYLDYYEKAIYNHILSSENPDKGGFVYFTPMRPQHYRVYSQPQQSFWCCVGSGLENHGKYGEMIYLHDNKNIYVNFFIASELTWKEKEIKLTQNTDFPYSESTAIKINVKEPKKFGLNIRNPKWVKDNGLTIKVNGEIQKIKSVNKIYITIDRTWKNGDSVSIELPMKTQLEYLPDQSSWASVTHGPIVLAAITDTSNLDDLWADDSRMGHIASGKLYPINDAPMIVSENSNFVSAIEPVPGKLFTFKIKDLIYPVKFKNLELVPFFSIHEARYMIYWPVVTPQGLEIKKEEIKLKEKEKLLIESLTIDQVAPGEQQPESDHNFKGEQSSSGVNKDMHWRDATGWFSYYLKDADKEARFLRITYYGLDANREFQILLNNMLLASVNLDGSKGDTFYDIDYEIPQNLIKTSKGILNLKFMGINGKAAGGIYYIRLMKKNK